MTTNPYESPGVSSDASPVHAKPRRPRGITFLAILWAVAAIPAVVNLVRNVFILRFSNLPWQIIIVALVISLCQLSVALGLVRRQRWSWWVSGWVISLAVIAGAATLGLTLWRANLPLPRVREELFQTAAAFAFGCAVLAYHLKGSVVDYFELHRTSKRLALASWFVCSVGFVLVLLPLIWFRS